MTKQNRFVYSILFSILPSLVMYNASFMPTHTGNVVLAVIYAVVSSWIMWRVSAHRPTDRD